MNKSNYNWRLTVLNENSTVRQAIQNLNESSLKIVLVVNHSDILVGTITDGDIRRFLFKGLDLDCDISNVINRNSLTASPVVGSEAIKEMMLKNKVQQIPIVDDAGKLVGLHLWDELLSVPNKENIIVIMAGGRGSRLLPLTQDCPKPLVRVAGKPMLEHIIERAKLAGFHNFVISIHHLGHMIKEYFGNGNCMNVHIDYLEEEVPLGTAGALSLLNPRPNVPFVITNGDIISDIRYEDLLKFHIEHDAIATMAVHLYEWEIPFGVVKTKGLDIIGFEEKPSSKVNINAGIYVLSPSAMDSLINNEHCDMPSLFTRLQLNSQKIIVYPKYERWLDVGRLSDHANAERMINEEMP